MIGPRSYAAECGGSPDLVSQILPTHPQGLLVTLIGPGTCYPILWLNSIAWFAGFFRIFVLGVNEIHCTVGVKLRAMPNQCSFVTRSREAGSNMGTLAEPRCWARVVGSLETCHVIPWFRAGLNVAQLKSVPWLKFEIGLFLVPQNGSALNWISEMFPIGMEMES
jgi:hypothetical protein